MTYANKITSLVHPSFDEIRSIAIKEIIHLPKEQRDQLHKGLERGTALLETHEHMCQYLFSFGRMHQAKLLDAYNNLDDSIFQQSLEIVDWGCGQAMGVLNLIDHLRGKGLSHNIRKITLIEPSAIALQRGILHLQPYLNNEIELFAHNKYFEELSLDDLKCKENRTVLHIFSNILDVAAIDLKKLSNLIDQGVVSDNYLICVGPLNPNNRRIDAFFDYFDKDLMEEIFSYETATFIPKNNRKPWTYKARIYKLEKNIEGHLIPIEYYPPVQFQAAYELDFIKIARRQLDIDYSSQLSHFEVAAPFDLGASVYDDIHPVFAVLNNIICRGLPTKPSIYIEEVFKEAFKLTKETIEYGEVKFLSEKTFNYNRLFELFERYADNKDDIPEKYKTALQLLLTPTAIARFQKVLLEAIITGQLSLEENQWKILIEEKDVPFGTLAVEDFKNHFSHLTQLSKDYTNVTLPDIELYVISNKDFINSPLQKTTERIYSKKGKLKSLKFDMVVTQSMLKSISSEIESFSIFDVKRDCYFNIRSITEVRTKRLIYTSDLIQYKPLIERSADNKLTEVLETKAHIKYFLQLLFRKKDFRPGQIPILNRALQNLPVIGLLPTGGGKSLTYQIAAILQPGVTMIIDPLKSLMKDQFDGLINSGIDCAAYINSSLSSKERKHMEVKLESSELLFVFLSPERLAIASFRQRLRHMHDYNVYFSYGVIDEVHCVSEWGHDFRFSYLHLGRNLYNYVRAKNKEISLFGLTATASFDVLADVERELSGNGAFQLDSETTVRYENTNRLELQYKIEKVPVEFEEDKYFDQNNRLDKSLPKALNVTNHWSSYKSKKSFLKDYYKIIPDFLSELQKKDNLSNLKEMFLERQGDSDLQSSNLIVEIDKEFYSKKETYNQAGIIFCPHVNKTGVSIKENKKSLFDDGIIDVTSFSGQDDDKQALKSMEQFRNNKSPLMVATKAFGMGIDKPNVRFTVNLNYSSSLEAFVQQAGRAGRDKKVALATILVSDYNLAQVSNDYPGYEFPLPILKNKWFKKEDLEKVLKFYNLVIPDEYLIEATPQNDIVKLHCKHNNKMFSFHECDTSCTEYHQCTLRKVTKETKGWKSEDELKQEIREQGLNISKKNFQYLNADYQTVMYFYNQSFKGDTIEKRFMYQLLMEQRLKVNYKDYVNGFLSSLISANIDEKVIISIPYDEKNVTDLSKAIYRMCCIELIDDFTQNYKDSEFRIAAIRKKEGDYFNGLKRFLERYYTKERALIELEKAKKRSLKKEEKNPIKSEIYKCLSYLIEFIYDKISEKRKRAIDDMRIFCMKGSEINTSWLSLNEAMKDDLYYYFNSKFARSDYVTENGEAFSLVEDTNGGKKSNEEVLFKYLRVIDEDVLGVSVPIDNIKHLYGAVRLTSRSLTDSNPTLNLLEVFCLAYLGVSNNDNLRSTLIKRYSEGMIEFSIRAQNNKGFWSLFDRFNSVLSPYLDNNFATQLIEETYVSVHIELFNKIKNKYLENYA